MGFSVKFPTSLEPLRPCSEKEEHDLLVGSVSLFGYSGTIAHAVVRQAPKNRRRRIGSKPWVDGDMKSSSGIMFMFTGQGSQYPGMGK